MYDQKHPNGWPGASDRSEQESHRDDDLEGLLDRPAWLPEAMADLDIYRHRCLCGQGFCTDNAFAMHLQACQAVKPI